MKKPSPETAATYQLIRTFHLNRVLNWSKPRKWYYIRSWTAPVGLHNCALQRALKEEFNLSGLPDVRGLMEGRVKLSRHLSCSVMKPECL